MTTMPKILVSVPPTAADIAAGIAVVLEHGHSVEIADVWVRMEMPDGTVLEPSLVSLMQAAENMRRLMEREPR